MSAFSQSPALNFPEWIEIATRAIAAPDDRARFRTEIQAHYADIVAQHLQIGLSAPAAQAAALADLGPPAAATLRFKLEHLTKADVQCVAVNMSRARSKIWLASLCLLFPLIVFCGLIQAQEHFPNLSPWFWPIFLLLSLAWITFQMTIYRFARRQATMTTVRQILLLEDVGWFIFGLILWAAFPDKSDSVFLVYFFGLLLFQRLQLRRKLQFASEDWSAMLSQLPRAS